MGLAVRFLAGSLRAANPGDEVIVLYNSRVPESKSLAEYYAERRHVPTNQIFGFALSKEDDMTRAEFRDDLQKPLAKLLESRNLWHIRSVTVPATTNQPIHTEWRVRDTKIRYAVICYGIPFRIRRDPSLNEKIEETLRPELRRNEAAVDSELAMLPYLEQHLPLAGPFLSPLYTATNAAAFSPTNGVLLVARLDGPSAAIARGLVDKAIEAETHGLWGRAYFDLRGLGNDTVYKAGDDSLRTAAEICRHLGLETVVDENAGTFPAEFPMSQIGWYCGWYDNDVSGPFTRTNVEFMPGALAYHLHSYSAHQLRSATHNWVGPLLAKGATITLGTVDEPYLVWTPDMSVLAGRMIFYGFTFGEAAYASQAALSWQTTVVGDPLYRPFAKPPAQLHEELIAQHDPHVEWSYLRLVDLNLAKGLPNAEMAGYLEKLDTTKHSAVLTEKLGDLYVALGKPTSAIEAYERALTLGPSPQQRVRLRLALADKWTASGHEQDAFDHLEKLLQENPDYPAKTTLYHRLKALAEKLGHKDVAARYEERIQALTPPPAPGAK